MTNSLNNFLKDIYPKVQGIAFTSGAYAICSAIPTCRAGMTKIGQVYRAHPFATSVSVPFIAAAIGGVSHELKGRISEEVIDTLSNAAKKAYITISAIGYLFLIRNVALHLEQIGQ